MKKIFFIILLCLGYGAVWAQQAGDLDSSFGQFGRFIWDIGPNAIRPHFYSIKHSSGKLYLISNYFNRNPDSSRILISVWGQDGQPDLNFGPRGQREYLRDSSDFFTGIYHVVEAANGSLVISGVRDSIPAAGGGPIMFGYILNILADGQINTAFGRNGYCTSCFPPIQAPPNTQTHPLQLYAHDSFVYAIRHIHINYYDMIRFRLDGQMDSSWADNGRLMLPVLQRNAANSLFTNKMVHFYDNGDFVISNKDLLLRYLANGQVDSSFGQGGTVLFPPLTYRPYTVNGNPAHLNATAWNDLYANDTVIYFTGVTGLYEPDMGKLRLYKVFPSGLVDSSFGLGGFAYVDFGLEESYDRSILVQPDGRIVVGGAANMRDNSLSYFAMARFMPSGQLDSSFGQGGIVLTQFIGGDDQRDVGLFLHWEDNGRKIIQTGYAYHPSLATDPVFPPTSLVGARFHTEAPSLPSGQQDFSASLMPRLLGNPLKVGAQELRLEGMESREPLPYFILDVSGRVLHRDLASPANPLVLSLPNLPQGQYWLCAGAVGKAIPFQIVP